ncbi:glucose-6-phosphate dehydrogenase [Paenibacillus frigoriresistens]|uniref:glucose-6-phosphate dehydrogenase n=1 Tax=Paenibacillus alginolyticus TaxID=59839 RepID=UPI001564C038|nr:glucose-6-phosphate dehydrogenase [Paenibacillus frigoriresistens]NRF95668.1 glucose-6-phosphate dehydrogenase [Paenibacillus frigoriresistens]
MEAATVVVFGATGDLARRKIYPALFSLFIGRKLSHSFSVIGLGRREISNEVFQEQVRESLRNFYRHQTNDHEVLRSFLDTLRYCALDVERKEDYPRLLHLVECREKELNIPGNRMFYLSVAPEYFDVASIHIKDSGLGSTKGWKRLVIEKPFGQDLSSARHLNDKLSKAFEEHEIYRIDHYLGKPMVQKLGEMLHDNPGLQGLWTSRTIANVQITASETLGVEKRAGYYDHVGATRDMFQNHMLQLLMMLTIELPKRSAPEEVSLRKRRFLESIRPLEKRTMAHNVVRGQYAAGEVLGEAVVGYIAEPGIEHSSRNETFIAARLRVDDGFWSEIPFYIRTGKRMKEKLTSIVIEFKGKSTQCLSDKKTAVRSIPAQLVIKIDPNESITFQLINNGINQEEVYESILLNSIADNGNDPEAYEKLIHDALRGDSTYFAHWDEVELSWKWVQPILEAYEENLIPLYVYPAGSYGPVEAERLLKEDGFRRWEISGIREVVGRDGESANWCSRLGCHG